jgi:HTH-type transcriptional regulator/antitoxin HigA
LLFADDTLVFLDATLWGSPEGSAESDQLDVLATLIEKYEEAHFPMDLPDPVDAILFRMGQPGLSRRDLEPMLGPRNRVSEVLNRRRGMSIEMIRELHDKLHIPAEVLIRPSKKSLLRAAAKYASSPSKCTGSTRL